jgi:diguanylate cyclase (GGDEF)-like protein
VRNQDRSIHPISQPIDSGYFHVVTRDETKPGEVDPSAEVAALRQTIAQLEERVKLLDELAHQDALLSVPNRRGFLRELEWLIDRVSRYGESAAMLFVDIDGLKQINDRFGHKAGDEALVHVAGALTEGVRRSDCVARLGGDEFGILLAHASEDVARETATRLAQQIGESRSICDGHELALGVAIGFTMIAGDDRPDAVIARADKSMYREKSAAA